MPYEIKPLVWEHHHPNGWLGSWRAPSNFGIYEVSKLRPFGGVGTERFRCVACTGSETGFVADCTSFDDGKAQCEAHYRARVLECLVEVQP